MKKLLALWNWLNGKKTAVGAAFVMLARVVVVLNMPEYVVYVDYAAELMIALGLLHKGWKVVSNPPV